MPALQVSLLTASLSMTFVETTAAAAADEDDDDK